MTPNTPNTDQIYAPVAVALKLGAGGSFGIGSGIKGPVTKFRDNWVIPIGAYATYATGHVLIGASWVFGSFDAATDNPAAPKPPIKGVELRVLQAWISYTWYGEPRRARPRPVVEVAVKPRVTADPLLAPTPVPPPAPEKAPVFPGTTAIADSVIAELAAEHAKALASCEGSYELSGQVTIGVLVNEKGLVKRTSIASTIGNIVVSDCLLGEVRGWQFPAPPNAPASGEYTITYR